MSPQRWVVPLLLSWELLLRPDGQAWDGGALPPGPAALDLPHRLVFGPGPPPHAAQLLHVLLPRQHMLTVTCSMWRNTSDCNILSHPNETILQRMQSLPFLQLHLLPLDTQLPLLDEHPHIVTCVPSSVSLCETCCGYRQRTWACFSLEALCFWACSSW